MKAGGEGTTEDGMVGWHHWLDGHEFEQTPGVGNGQGGLACCSPWGHKSRTLLSNWTELNLEINTWSDISTRTFAWSGMSFLVPWDKKNGHETSPKYGRIYDHGERLWNRIFPSISINKDVTVVSDLGPPNVNQGSWKGKQSLRCSRCRPHAHPWWLLKSWVEEGG